MILLICGISKNKTNEQIVIDKENQQVVARGEEGSGKKGTGEID